MGFRSFIRRIRFPRRPRLQYGLRSLLIVTLFVCIALGWYVERVRRQQRAVAALTADGAKIYYYDGRDQFYFDAAQFAEGTTVEEPHTITEWAEYLTPARIRTALGVAFFRAVDRVECPWEFDLPRDLLYLRDLRGLRQLELNHALDDDLAVLRSLGDLTHLELWDSIVSDAGLAHLTELWKLERLNIRFAGRDVLSTLPHQPITDAGLAHLADLRRLKYLGLFSSSIHGDGLRHLEEMTELEQLDLGATQITDTALAHLARLPQLKYLDIHGTAITEGLAQEILPKTKVRRYGSGSERLTRGKALADAGCWSDALDALNEESASWLRFDRPQINRSGDSSSADALIGEDGSRRYALFIIGQCHAELGQTHEAAEFFCRLLDIVHASPPPMGGLVEGKVWQQLYEYPDVFQSVGRARSHDAWQWITLAQRAVVDGRWADAADDYARAKEIPGSERIGTGSDLLLFECGVSRILMDDLPGHERLCKQIDDLYRRLAEQMRAAHPEFREQPSLRYFWPASAHLWLLAPQGTMSASELADWSRHEAYTIGETWLVPLLYCRAGEFQKALRKDRPERREEMGRFWFCRALAHHYLEHSVEARDCYARGSFWLEHHMKRDRILGVQRYVADYLECEALRREAKRLIGS